MAGARGGIFIPIVGDESDLIRSLERAQAELRTMAGTAVAQGNKAGGALSRLGAAGKNIKNKLLGPLKGLGPALGAAAVVKFGSDSFKAFAEAEKAAATLDATLAKFPATADTSSASITALAGAIAKKTAAEDDSIVSGAATLAQFGLTGKQIEGTLPLLVDYARRTGKDVPTAAKSLGKAFLGQTRSLKEVGINYKSTGDRGKDFANITEALRGQVGGFAQKELGSSTSAKLENMRNQFGNLQEVVGQKLAGAFKFLTDNAGVLIPIVGTLTAAIIAYKTTVAIAGVVTTVFGQAAGKAWLAAAGPVALVVAAVVGLGIVIFKFRDQILGALQAVGRFFASVFGRVKAIVVGVWNAIKGATRAVWGAITAYFRLVFGIYRALFLGVWNGIKAIVTGVWRAITGGARAAWNGLVGFFKGAFRAFTGFWTGAWDRIVRGFARIFGGIGDVAKGPLNLVIGLINRLLGGFNNLIKGFNRIPGVPNIPLIPEIPKLDRGGIVARTGIAVVHEGEAWSGVGRNARGFGGVNVTVVNQGTVVGSGGMRELAREIRDELVLLARRNNTTGLV